MFKVIKNQKARRLLTFIFEILVGVGIYIFILFSENIIGYPLELSIEIIFAYVVFVFFVEIVSTITTFNKFEVQVRKNHQNIKFLLGADIAEGYRFSQLGMLHFDNDLTILWTKL